MQCNPSLIAMVRCPRGVAMFFDVHLHLATLMVNIVLCKQNGNEKLVICSKIIIKMKFCNLVCLVVID